MTLGLRRSAVSLAVAAALPGAMLAPQLAVAQESDDAEIMEEVVTYGKFRQSLVNSIDAKRTNSSIVEAITAEDLGKLPDVSIAESLARLPGLTVQRLNGRGQVVNIRGMSPDFSTGLLNGREQVSVGDNRGVEFDQYPSELLQQVIVYKTPDAALIGQGLSGTVDMRTVRPLEYGERALTLNARLSESEYDLVSTQDTRGQRLSASYIDQFADSTVGLVVGVAHTTTPNFGRNNNTWGYYVGDGDGNVAIGGGRVFARASELERNSFTVGLDFKPTDNATITFDSFISDFSESQIRHGLVYGFLEGLTATDSERLTDDFSLVTAGSYDSSYVAVENNALDRTADLQSFAVNFDYQFANGWVGNIDLSHSGIKRDDADFESTNAPWDPNRVLPGDDPADPQRPLGAGMNDTVTFQSGPDGTRFGTGNDFSNTDYATMNAVYATSPFGWGDGNALAPVQPAGQFGFGKVFTVNDDINAFRAELERDLDWGAVSGIELGYNFTNREKDRFSDEGVITSNLQSGGEFARFVEIPDNIGGVADLSWGTIGGNTQIRSFDPRAMIAAGITQQQPYLYDDIIAKSWVVEEDVQTVYTKFEVDTLIGNMPLSGNFGLAYQFWDQKSTGASSSGSGAGILTQPLSDSKSDSEILPSLNLVLDITDNQKIRFGAARTLARPRMDELKASVTYTYNEGRAALYTQADIDAAIAAGTPELVAYDELSPWKRGENGQGRGNTQLDPWIADGYDLSYEYYLPDGYGYVSAAIFYKDLKSYVFDQNRLVDFSDLEVTSTVPTDIALGVATDPQNGQGGSIEGWEFAASLDLGIFTPALEGLGFLGNYSRNDSDIEPNGPGSGSQLPGLSKNVWNLTAYFERGGFSARVNTRYRDGYVGEVAGFGGARTGSDIREEQILDAQIGYEFQSGALQGLSLLAQAQNLTDEPFRTVNAAYPLPQDFQTFGTTYQIGFSYSLY